MKITNEYKEVRPILKGIVALVLHLRHPLYEVKECFKQAEVWLEEVEKS